MRAAASTAPPATPARPVPTTCRGMPDHVYYGQGGPQDLEVSRLSIECPNVDVEVQQVAMDGERKELLEVGRNNEGDRLVLSIRTSPIALHARELNEIEVTIMERGRARIVIVPVTVYEEYPSGLDDI